MKYRIIGFVLVVLVVGGLYLATEGLPSGSSAEPTSDQPYVPPSSSDNEFKNLKIN
jgi:hypothetical protein